MGLNVHSNGWPTKALIDCTADGVISYGIVQPGQNTNDGVPIVRVNNFKQGRLDVSDVLRVAASVEDNYKRTRLRGGEVLLTLVGSTGQTAIASSKLAGWNVARAIAVIRPTDEIGAKWISICLQSVETKQFLDDRANTTVQKTLNLADVKRIPIPLPPEHVRRSIESVFSSLDDKIDLNRRINQDLEAMAQAIFKSWFVDFDVVKAKIAAIKQGEAPQRAAMRVISGKTDAELDEMPREHHDQLAITAALFPDAMEESELGDIPMGWNIKSVADLARYAVGKIDVSSLTIENYISTENMIENRGGVGRASSLPVVSTVPSFKKGQVLISNIRPYFKKIWMARFDGGRSNDVLCFETKEEGCREFIYNLLYQDDFFEFMMRTSKGAKMPRGDKDAIAGWKFPCASPELRCAFSERVRPFYLHIENLNSESRQISALRDTLLPKLLCGELSVPSNLSDEEGQ